MTNNFNTSFPGAHNLNSLVCDGNGTLYAADGSTPGLYSYSIATYTWTFIGLLNGYLSAGDVVFYNGVLHMATTTNEIITIDPVTGNVLSATPMTASNVFGLGIVSTASICDAGTMSMIASAGDSLYSINPATGVCTSLCPNIIPPNNFIGGIASVFEGLNPPNTAVQAYALSPSICLGSSTTLVATGADFFLWQPGNFTGSSIIVQPAVTTTYSVIGTDSAGCSDTTQITVQVNNPLVVNGTSQQADCSGLCTGSATANVISGNGPFTYWWTPFSPPGATASSLCAGAYSCTITGAGGCSATVSFVITQPPALISTPSQTNVLCHGGNSGSASMVVSGGTPGYSYWWWTGGTSATENNLNAGSFVCTATDSAGCSVTEVFLITEPPALVPTVSSSTPCGLNNGSAEIFVSGGTPGYTYAWSPSGGNAAQATGLASGNYTCTVTDANGCTQTQTVAIVTNPPPVISISADTVITAGGNIMLNATGGIRYSWNPSTGLSCANCQNPVANPTQTTEYCVQVTDGNGCVDSACVVVAVSDCDEIFIPNAFSPNNDNANDQLCVRGTECIMAMQFAVFDRWGEKVFESTDPAICWDGMLRGQPAMVAVYVYELNATFTNGQQIHKHGNVSLVR